MALDIVQKRPNPKSMQTLAKVLDVKETRAEWLWLLGTIWQAASRNPGRWMNETLSDQELVVMAKQGEPTAFAELVQRYYQRALRVAFGMLHQRTDAEDVVQEAFVRVHMRLNDFEGSSAFYTWLYRIVVNLSIDALRRRRREQRATPNDDAISLHPSGDELWPNAEPVDPEQHVERQDLAEAIYQALAELPEIHRAVFYLRELEDMSYGQIAQTLGIRKGTVMSRLFHARQALQKLLRQPKDKLS